MIFKPDAAGRVQLKTDQNGDTVTFNYDLEGRMFKRDYRLKVNSPSGTIADSDTFTFDKSSRMLTAVSGRYANMVTMTYAANDGHLQNESLTIGGQTYTVARTYDARGQLFQMTYPNGAVVARAYTDRGQLNTVKYKDTSGGTLNTEDTRTYDLGGRLSTSAYRNGVTTTYAYRSSGAQKDNLLASISFAHPAGVTNNDDKVGTHTNSWDVNKNKSSETITGAATAYINFGFTTAGGSDPDGYDDEDRLVYFKRTGTTNPQSWNLSLVGDWNSYSDFGTNQNRTHGPAHEILTAGATPNNVVTHDVKGNITDIPTNISSPARKLLWDFDNRLKGVDNTGDSIADVTYEFDALGRRVARTQGSTAVVYIPVGQQTIADYTRGTAASTTPLYRYVFGDYIDEPILRQTGNTSIHYYHHNQQYSTVALTTSTGFVTERYAYTAYGVLSILTNTGTTRPWTDTSNRYTYTGREWDDNAYMYYFRSRWLEPLLGRFINRDPIGFVDGLSLYRSYFNVTHVDPQGTMLFDNPWWDHYFGGDGADFNINSNAILDKMLKDHSETKRAMRLAFDTAIRQATKCGKHGIFDWMKIPADYGNFDDLRKAVFGVINLAPLGNTIITATWLCDYERDCGAITTHHYCMTGRVKYSRRECLHISCSIDLDFSDRFVDVFDLFDVMEGNQDFGGVPYDIEGLVQDNVMYDEVEPFCRQVWYTDDPTPDFVGFGR